MNHYAVLEISTTATPAEIRQAYIKQSLMWHPDRHETAQKQNALLKFQQIAQAYDTLCDPEKKRAYDAKSSTATTTIDAFSVFTRVFDDLLIPSVPNPQKFWEPIGGVSGAVLGFIVFNIPGSIFGYYMCSKAGKVRDMKGVCVYDAFMRLSGEERSSILQGLAVKLFKSTLLTA